MRLLTSYTASVVFTFSTSSLLPCFAGPIEPQSCKTRSRSSQRCDAALPNNELAVAHPHSANLIKHFATPRTIKPDISPKLPNPYAHRPDLVPTITERDILTSIGNATHLSFQSVSAVLDATSAAALDALKRLYNGLIYQFSDPVAIERGKTVSAQLFIGFATLRLFFEPVDDHRHDVAAELQRFAQAMLKLCTMGIAYGAYHLVVLSAKGTLWAILWINRNGGNPGIVGRRNVAGIDHPSLGR